MAIFTDLQYYIYADAGGPKQAKNNKHADVILEWSLIKIIALLHILLPLIKTFYQTNTTFLLYPFEFQLKNEKVSFPAFNSRPF